MPSDRAPRYSSGHQQKSRKVHLTWHYILQLTSSASPKSAAKTELTHANAVRDCSSRVWRRPARASRRGCAFRDGRRPLHGRSSAGRHGPRRRRAQPPCACPIHDRRYGGRQAMPGVLLVLTRRTSPISAPALPRHDQEHRRRRRWRPPPYPVLARGTVRHVGDAVAFIVAETADAGPGRGGGGRDRLGAARRGRRASRRRGGRARRSSGPRLRATSPSTRRSATARRPTRPSRRPTGSSR